MALFFFRKNKKRKSVSPSPYLAQLHQRKPKLTMDTNSPSPWIIDGVHSPLIWATNSLGPMISYD